MHCNSPVVHFYCKTSISSYRSSQLSSSCYYFNLIFQANKKQTLELTEQEGFATHMDVQGDFLAVVPVFLLHCCRLPQIITSGCGDSEKKLKYTDLRNNCLKPQSSSVSVCCVCVLCVFSYLHIYALLSFFCCFAVFQ
jgi:hypothetical protein